MASMGLFHMEVGPACSLPMYVCVGQVQPARHVWQAPQGIEDVSNYQATWPGSQPQPQPQLTCSDPEGPGLAGPPAVSTSASAAAAGPLDLTLSAASMGR